LVEQIAPTTTAVGHHSPMERTDDDVIYLCTFKVKDPYQTTDASQRRTKRNGRACRNHVTSTKPVSRKRRYRRTDTASTLRIPAEMAYKHIRLGVMKDFAGLRRAVYGFFDRVGRFRCRMEIGQYASPVDLGPHLSATLVTHDQVEYRSRFRGLTHQQVQREFRCQLARKLYSHAADGEI
ncbi:hypothetical protein CT0861_09603, partial [Colletotrichum tofieldiae]